MRLVAGSPPRRWGTRGTGRATAPTPRFTPTQVGNTSMTDRERAVSAVHPHAGGEHCLSCAELRPRGGSPPRRWGTQAGRYTPKTALRFTPTQVGNTYSIHIGNAIISVHPHAGGEHRIVSGEPCVTIGSPPRRWGTHFESRRFEAIEQASSMDHGCLVINFNPSHSVTILSAAPQNSIPKPCSQCLL